jgi:hypothetical protein
MTFTSAMEHVAQAFEVLGVIVLIRTVLSFSLEIDIQGVAPWRRVATSGAKHFVRAVRGARTAERHGPVDPRCSDPGRREGRRPALVR